MPMPRPRPVRSVGLWLAALSGVAFGVATVVARDLARTGVTPETVLVVRFGLGALCLGALALGRGRSLPLEAAGCAC